MKIQRRIAYASMFTALAIALSIMESYFPLAVLIPIPGVKLGLANIVTVFALVTMRPSDAAAILVTRCLVVGLFTGPVSLFFSLCGAFLSWCVMIVMLPLHNKFFSVPGISMGGAVAHSIGQIIAAVILLKDTALIFYYLPILMIISLFTGAITGIAALPVIKTVKFRS